MKFSDLFVPKYMHSNPEVRTRAVDRITDVKLLAQMAEQDEDERVRMAAQQRLVSVKS